MLPAFLALCLMAAPGRADVSTDLAAALAPQVLQVGSGGTWEDGGKKGYYRAVVIAPPDANVGSQVFIQWMSAAEPAHPSAVVTAVPVKEINGAKLLDALLSMEFEKNNEFTVYIEPNDPAKAAQQSFTVTATAPGKYTIETGPPPE
jgi:hypothetical protein